MGHVLPLEQAKQQLTRLKPDLVVLVLSPNPDAALSLPAELRGLVQGRILAVGPASDTRLVLRSLRSGADDYVDEGDLDYELDAALTRMRDANSAQTEPGRLIVMLAPSGGSGSSTLAVNVATALAKQHNGVGLVDLKLEAGDLASLLDLRPNHTLADLCQNSKQMDRAIFERCLVKHEETGVHLLAAPRHFSDVGHVTAGGVRQALTLARSSFPYVVVDLEHSFREEHAQVLRQADIILLVMRLDFTSLRNTRRVLDQLEQMDITGDRVMIVVNRYGQAKEVTSGQAEAALGVKIAHYVPDDPKTINRATNTGVPVVIDAPKAKVSRSLLTLAASVNGRHHP